MKRKEIVMLVCAFLLGFFLNAILKSSCMSKLYEGLEVQGNELHGCTGTNILQILRAVSTGSIDALERSHLEALGCEEAIIQQIMDEIGPSN